VKSTKSLRPGVDDTGRVAREVGEGELGTDCGDEVEDTGVEAS
jgi:hypothetical protein